MLPPLSAAQEQQLVDALVSLDWMQDDDRKSCELIRQWLGCTMKGATEVLEYLYVTRKLIRPKYPAGEELRPGVQVPKTRWKWERGARYSDERKAG